MFTPTMAGYPLRDVVYAATSARCHARLFREYGEDRFPVVFRVPAPVNRQRLYDPESLATLTVG
jgi:hypothetical protein